VYSPELHPALQLPRRVLGGVAGFSQVEAIHCLHCCLPRLLKK
jgi:hypothetical protein